MMVTDISKLQIIPLIQYMKVPNDMIMVTNDITGCRFNVTNNITVINDIN